MLTNKEKIELVRAWIKTLRSKKYTQGTGVLRSGNNKFCCLGVLCDLFDKTLWKTRMMGIDSDFLWNGSYYSIRNSELASIFESETLSLDQETLADLNDDGSLFEEIADFIEKDLNENMHQV